MITTITTTTVVVAAGGLAVPLGVISTVLLLALLVNKELINTQSSPGYRNLDRVLNVVIVPLLMVFAFAVVLKLITLMAG